MKILLSHIWLLLTFRHDGTGLFVKNTKAVLVIVMLTTIIGVTQDLVMNHDLNWLGDAAGGFLMLCFMWFAFDRRGLVGFCLLGISSDVMLIVLKLFDLATPMVHMAFLTWTVTGFLVLLFRSSRRVDA